MDVSIVIPAFDERDNVRPLHEELVRALAEVPGEVEVIYVDDGSTDGTAAELAAIAATDPRVTVVRLARNYGQTAALAAGIERSRGRWVVTLDADRQNDPSDIPRLLEQAEQGFDLVAGWRVERRDPFLSRRLPSMVANRLIGAITGVRLHDYGCTLRVIRGDLARSMRLYGEMHRFIPALVSDLGARIVEVPVHHRPRVAGASKYGLSRTVRVVLDLVTVKFLSSYGTRPIHIFGTLGLGAGAAGGAILVYLTGQKVLLGARIGQRPLLLLGVLLVILGLQFVSMGLLAELLVRTYHESQGKPVYRVETVEGGGSEGPVREEQA